MEVVHIEEQCYVYIWYYTNTNHVFYVGRGHGSRYKSLKDRNRIFRTLHDNNQCNSMILYDKLTLSESEILEELLINHFWEIGQAEANIHKGGKIGGDTFSRLPDKDKKTFVDKMAKINKERCSTAQFKDATSKRMSKKYESETEREKQRQIIRAAWDSKKCLQHSIDRKRYVADHPEFLDHLHQLSSANNKKCILEYDGKVYRFASLKELKVYLRQQLGIKALSRKVEQEMLHNKTPYFSSRSNLKHLNGMKMYYEV